ncbi:hypothetical protein B0H13DRAFT_1882096 [Mycena leptocephala]|nr:hypothetical protein B0H13DRAFT_1882096 [Mycena leptocephala]
MVRPPPGYHRYSRRIQPHHHDPAHFYPAMGWDASMGRQIPEPQAYSEWRPSVRARKHGKDAVIDMDSGQIPQKSRKRVRENAHSPEDENEAVHHVMSPAQYRGPVGLT